MDKVISIFLLNPAVSIWEMSERQADWLRSAMPQHEVRLCKSEEDFLASLPDTEIALTWTFKQEWLALAPKLKVISTPAAGKDYFHVDPPAGLRMMNGQFHGELMGETAVGAILAMTRGILPAVTTYRDSLWPRTELTPGMRPLRGSRILIVGFGHIGQWIGQLLKPFGTTIVGMRRNLNAPKPHWFDENDAVIDETSLEALLPSVDHVVLALPSGQDTDNLLDAKRLDMLPKHATLTNVGRGNSVDNEHLADMLENNLLAGACLDVFPQEPLPGNSKLRNRKNLWIFPHSSAIAPNYLDLYLADFVRQFGA